MEQFLFSMGRIGFLLILLSVACTPLQKDLPQTSLPTTCIQGTVLYRLPADTDPLPYARVKVAVWRHGTDRALAETQTNEKGRYCIEVPMTPTGVDLRVWGMRTVEYDKYVCKGSADDIDVGSVSQRCGTGGCPTVDITTECNRYVSPRRLK